MSDYNDYYKAKQKILDDKKDKRIALEKQMKIWQDRQKEMRKIVNPIDPAFHRRQLDKCEQEIARISESLIKL